MSDSDTPTPESAEEAAAASLVSADEASARAEEASARWAEAKSDADDKTEAAEAARDALAEIGADALEALEKAVTAAKRSFDLADACTRLTRVHASDLAKKALEAKRGRSQTESSLAMFEESLAAREADLTDAESALSTSQADEETKSAARAKADEGVAEHETLLPKSEADLRPLETTSEAAAAEAREAAAAATEEAEALAEANTKMAAQAQEVERLTRDAEAAVARVDQGQQVLTTAQKDFEDYTATFEKISARAAEAAAEAITKSQAMARATTPAEMQQVATEVGACARSVADLAAKQEVRKADLDEAGEALALAKKALSMAKTSAEAAEGERDSAVAALAAEEANLGQGAVKTKLAGEKAAAAQEAVQAYDLARIRVDALRIELKEAKAALRKSDESLAAASAASASAAALVEAKVEARNEARTILEEERSAASGAISKISELEEASEAAAAEVDDLAKRASLLEQGVQAHEAAAAKLKAELPRREAPKTMLMSKPELEPQPEEAVPEGDDPEPQPEDVPEGSEVPNPDTITLTISTPDANVGVFCFSNEVVTLGRDKGCDVHLDSEIVSRRHAEIRRSEGLFALVDMNTSNGTILNGKRVSELTLLNDGDGIGIGKFRIHFSALTSASAFRGLENQEVTEDSVDLGSMTLRMSPQSAKRAVGDFNRVRGFVVLERKGSPDLKRQVMETFQVGKDPCCDLILKGWFVPRKAALITRGLDRYTLINMSPSPKSVLVNEKQVADRVELEHGSKIEVYGEEFRFEFASALP